MNLSILGHLLGTALILIAIWYFDWQNWNYILVSVLLFLSGIITLLSNNQSKSLIKLKNFFQVIGGVITLILLIKLIFID